MKRVVVRVIGDDTVEVEGGRHRDRVFIPESELGRITGWVLKPEGLCRDDACVLVPGRAVLGPDGWIDVASLGAAVGQPVAIEAAAGLAVIGHPAAERAESLASLTAPDVRLPTVAGSSAGVYDFSGCKRLVVTFASWCGCRHDLPAWQALQDRFGDNNFCVLAVAVDESVDDVQPWVDEAKATYPVLIDADRTFVELYGIRNVPTVIWIDEDDRIVRPNASAFSTDMFAEFPGVHAGPHLDALRSWMRDGTTYDSDDEARADQSPPDDDQQLARPTSGSRSSSGDSVKRTWPNDISCGPASSRPTTSPSGAARCRCGARTRSASRSSSCTGSGKPQAGRTTPGPPKNSDIDPLAAPLG